MTLPAAQKGDQIRVLDVTDALTYNKSIIVKTGTAIPVQGATDGTLVIQTPGAGIGLLYINAVIGWRLIEL